MIHVKRWLMFEMIAKPIFWSLCVWGCISHDPHMVWNYSASIKTKQLKFFFFSMKCWNSWFPHSFHSLLSLNPFRGQQDLGTLFLPLLLPLIEGVLMISSSKLSRALACVNTKQHQLPLLVSGLQMINEPVDLWKTSLNGSAKIIFFFLSDNCELMFSIF